MGRLGDFEFLGGLVTCSSYRVKTITYMKEYQQNKYMRRSLLAHGPRFGLVFRP